MRGYDDDTLRRAARLHRIPGVRIAEVCERTGVSRHALKRAREVADLTAYPWPRDLVLSALTDAGRRTSGPWPNDEQLATLASYLDYVDKSGATRDTVRDLLDLLVEARVLRRARERFELLEPFP